MNSPALIGRPWPGSGSTPLPSIAGWSIPSFVPQRIEVGRLRAEVLHGQNADAGKNPRTARGDASAADAFPRNR
jgi:hypothetical protein